MHLVKMLRDFSMLFYKCRKTGKPLHKFYKIYRMSRCGQCGGGVTRCMPGEYERGTYFCAACQTNALGGGPSRNSLLSWAQAGASWECVLHQYTTLVKPTFEEFCIPTKKYADVIIPRGAENVVAIDLIKQHIEDVICKSHTLSSPGTAAASSKPDTIYERSRSNSDSTSSSR